MVDVVVPVHNEERGLETSVRRLHRHLEDFPFPARITIADNASTDGTWRVARRLERELAGVRALRLAEKGRGRALRAAWGSSGAPVLAYMDVDLSTDLAALLPLVAPVVSGHSDVAIGSRLAPGARVVRGTKRELISRGYNVLLRTALCARFSDAQCGFKAIRADVARALLPLVRDGEWFFDTELLVLAERAGLRIHEVPVDWVDDPDSRVAIVDTALADLRGVARLAWGLVTGSLGARLPPAARDALAELSRQLGRFTLVGAAGTLVYLALFVVLSEGLSAEAANAVALSLVALASSAAHRRLTFAVRGPARRARQLTEALLVYGLGLALTTGSLAALDAVAPGAGRALQVATLIGATALSGLVRFVLLRGWVFHPGRTRP